jgi:hypothetical protein
LSGSIHRLIYILIAAFILDAIVAKTMSQTMDEADHTRYGIKILRGNPDRSEPYMDGKAPATALNALPRVLAAQIDSFPRIRKWLWSLVRLPSILAALLVIVIIYSFAYEWYGIEAALAGAAMAALSPNLIAHGTIATNDGYFAAGVLLALYFFHRYLQQPDLRNACISAFTLAVAQLTKPLAIYLYPLVGFFVILGMVRSIGMRLRSRDALAYAAVAFGFAVAVLNVAYSFDRSFTPLRGYAFESEPSRKIQGMSWIGRIPVPLPYPVLQGFDQMLQVEKTGSTYGNVYLLGELRSVTDPAFHGFKSYYVVAWLFKEPIPLQILFIWGMTFVVMRRRKDFLFNEGLILAAGAVLFVWLSLFSKAQVGIRHILPVLAIEITIASAPFLQFGMASRPRRILLSCLVAWLFASTFSYFPHMIPYMNEWVWDRRSSYKILADSNLDWGQDAGLVRTFLKANPDVTLDPDEPTTGRVLVSADRLVGVAPKNKGPLTWALRYRPAAQIGYAHFLFVIPKGT